MLRIIYTQICDYSREVNVLHLKHTSKSTQKWFTEHKQEPLKLKDLERFPMEEWSQIPGHVFINIIGEDSRAVIWAKGGCKY